MNICKPICENLIANNRYNTPSNKRTENTAIIKRKNSGNWDLNTTADTRPIANNHSSLLNKILKQKQALKEFLKPRKPDQSRPKIIEKLICAKLTGKKPEGNEKQIKKVVARSNSAYSSTVNINNFSIGRFLGQGASAVVRSATYKPTLEKVALKTYDKFKMSHMNISREIKIMEKMNHPNIVKLLYKIHTPSEFHLAMELVNGSNLNSFLKQRGRLHEKEFKEVFRQILEAIGYCHSLNITHRDIKLDNILIDESKKVHIIDFGFSTCTSQKTRVFCGTPFYMAPEIVSNKECEGPPVDVWALGVLMFVLLSGNFPFRGTSEKELYKNIQLGEFSVPSHISTEAKALIEKMIHRVPNDRPSVVDLLNSSYFLG